MKIFVTGISAIVFISPAFAAGPEDLKFFHEQVAPLLVKNCAECHNANTHKGDLNLETLADALKGGENGAALVPGRPEDSPLYTRLMVQAGDDRPDMPKKKAALATEDVEKIRRWISAGAPWPKEIVLKESSKGDKNWWSLKKLSHPTPPASPNLPEAWSHSPIDRFVFAKLAQKNLAPNPAANPREFIRRVSYDLIGLPPTPEETAAFVRECAPGDLTTPQAERAIEKLVDRLLASPHYGEQWGRHWLDVVRFGESRGFERNLIIDNAWPFRDYVIRSFNEDKPFDRFIIEHLAGDAVGKDQPDVEVGTTFLAIGPYDDVGNGDPVAKANIRAATLDDMITATGTAFLGLSVNCAHCHDHKFDPIPQADYYRLRCAFEGVSNGEGTLATREEKERRRAAVAPLNGRLGKLEKEKQSLETNMVDRPTPQDQKLRPAPSARLTEERFTPTKAKFIKLIMLATSDSPVSGSNARIDEFEAWTAEATPRDVALASLGGKATGAQGRRAKDFEGAYGVHHVNDGKFGSRWIAGTPAVLTIEFAQPETVDHVVFSHDRTSNSDQPISGQGPCVAEYEIQVSEDGKQWRKVADSFDREPFNDALKRERRLRAAPAEERAKLAVLNKQIAQLNAELAKIPPLPLAWIGRFDQPATHTVVFKGGDPQKPGDEVKPASLAVLDQVTKPYELPVNAPEVDRRLALAQWIVRPDNPLTPRVLGNRLWHYHFGTGLVDTPSDFGFLGSLPSHPELLDWLATRILENGWRLKALQREICLSQTYRQSAASRADGASMDKDARLLWRFPPRRLDAEEIRDTMLSIAGQLDPHMGGPSYRLYEYKNDNVSTFVPLDHFGPETYRRAVYHQNARASVVDLLSDFDLPDNSSAEPRRSHTTTPLQTLTLLNQSFTLDMAHALADRVTRESSAGDAEAQVERVYALCFQRKPSARESAACLRVIQSHGLPALCRAVLNTNELIYLP